MVNERWEGRLRPIIVGLNAKIRNFDFILKEKRSWAVFTLWEKWSKSCSRKGALVMSCNGREVKLNMSGAGLADLIVACMAGN